MQANVCLCFQVVREARTRESNERPDEEVFGGEIRMVENMGILSLRSCDVLLSQHMRIFMNWKLLELSMLRICIKSSSCRHARYEFNSQSFSRFWRCWVNFHHGLVLWQPITILKLSTWPPRVPTSTQQKIFLAPRKSQGVKEPSARNHCWRPKYEHKRCS